KSVGALLRKIRLKRELTLEVVAGLAGITAGFLSRVERGEVPLNGSRTGGESPMRSGSPSQRSCGRPCLRLADRAGTDVLAASSVSGSSGA
ncbi:MAG: helix-turn-helix domain-containing protein, partial [Pseudonocardiaceae bacterium]